MGLFFLFSYIFFGLFVRYIIWNGMSGCQRMDSTLQPRFFYKTFYGWFPLRIYFFFAMNKSGLKRAMYVCRERYVVRIYCTPSDDVGTWHIWNSCIESKTMTSEAILWGDCQTNPWVYFLFIQTYTHYFESYLRRDSLKGHLMRGTLRRSSTKLSGKIVRLVRLDLDIG